MLIHDQLPQVYPVCFVLYSLRSGIEPQISMGIHALAGVVKFPTLVMSTLPLTNPLN